MLRIDSRPVSCTVILITTYTAPESPRFFTGHSIITLNPTNVTSVPIPPDLGFHTTLRSLGARLTRDTTVNRFYPTNGTFFTFTSDFVSQALGSKYTFQTYN